MRTPRPQRTPLHFCFMGCPVAWVRWCNGLCLWRDGIIQCWFQVFFLPCWWSMLQSCNKDFAQTGEHMVNIVLFFDRMFFCGMIGIPGWEPGWDPKSKSCGFGTINWGTLWMMPRNSSWRPKAMERMASIPFVVFLVIGTVPRSLQSRVVSNSEAFLSPKVMLLPPKHNEQWFEFSAMVWVMGAR